MNDINQYTNYEEIIEKEKHELVEIFTESWKHASIVLDCIAVGCSLIIEKSIVLSIKDIDAIINAAREKRVIVCVSHHNRFNKSIKKVREALEHNRFGCLFMVLYIIRLCRDCEFF